MYLVSRSGLRLRLFAVGRVYPILFLHHSIVMLCMLVTILSLDGVAGQGRGLRQRYVHLVARLCIDALLGPRPGAGCGSV